MKRKRMTLWDMYVTALRKEADRVGERAREKSWYWQPWDAYMAGYRAGRRRAHSR